MVAKSLRVSPPWATRAVGASSFCLMYSFAIRVKGCKGFKAMKIKCFLLFAKRDTEEQARGRKVQKKAVQDTLPQITLRGGSN